MVKARGRLRGGIALALAPFRGRRRVVLTAPDSVRGGNFLYQWALAASAQDAVPRLVVRHNTTQDPWIEEFPELERLSTLNHPMRFLDGRSGDLGMEYGAEWDEVSVARFAREYLFASTSFSARLDRARSTLRREALVINVRRGDYYGTCNEPEFGMRIEPYIREAVRRHEANGPISSIQFVSDDLLWCREHLAALCPDVPVYFERFGGGMFDDLALLAGARRLILANSTFSYWGGYLASASSGRAVDVVVPGFHQRSLQVSRGYRKFHMRSWECIEGLAGGWQESDERA